MGHGEKAAVEVKEPPVGVANPVGVIPGNSKDLRALPRKVNRKGATGAFNRQRLIRSGGR